MNILWDFDGTLFNTYPALVKGFIHLSGKDLDPNEVLKWLKVNSKVAFQHYGIEESQRQEYIKLYNQYSFNSQPFEHLEEVLQVADDNFIVTHRDKESTLFLLEKFKLLHYFKVIVSVEEEGFTRKPHAASYQHVIKDYPIDLVIGDRELDLIPARELGIKTVAFENPDIEADFHLDSYADFKMNVLPFL
ncbi:haloacid dehalogenase [Bacillus timonensis]|uniref:Haloacid dehalogenase n=1 Tax=Bacillus timonensis TaxID=1033734 RepID=A0A4S3PUF7_9BACI|nr:HAD-IA family hydrolase [Bacillus timonensis]THE13431.1 haloacid dehalogenase [Bacillus timonensis]